MDNFYFTLLNVNIRMIASKTVRRRPVGCRWPKERKRGIWKLLKTCGWAKLCQERGHDINKKDLILTTLVFGEAPGAGFCVRMNARGETQGALIYAQHEEVMEQTR